MHVDKSRLDAFRAAVSAQCEAARSLMETSIAGYLRRNPGAPVADVREYALALADTTEYVYGQAAAAATAQLYDQTAESLGMDLDPAELSELEDADQTEAVIRYQAGKLSRGDYAGFGAEVGRYLADRVLRTSWQTVIDNADRPRDRKLGIRYARVPTGRRTCGFCVMLASRGFVYRSKGLAGDLGPGVRFNSFHRGCDCVVIAGDGSTTVEGYEPDKMYEAYADARDTVRTGDWRRIVAEIDTRAPQWAYHGEPGRATYDKPRGALEPHERAGVDALLSHGFDLRVIPESGSARANLDLEMGGTGWEMKNVINASSASNQIKRARIKWFKIGGGSMRVIITSEGAETTFEETVSQIERRIRGGEEALVISDGGKSIRRIKK